MRNIPVVRGHGYLIISYGNEVFGDVDGCLLPRPAELRITSPFLGKAKRQLSRVL